MNLLSLYPGRGASTSWLLFLTGAHSCEWVNLGSEFGVLINFAGYFSSSTPFSDSPWSLSFWCYREWNKVTMFSFWLPYHTSDMQMTPPLWQKVKKSWRSSWESERGEWKVGLKLNIQKTKIMPSCPISLWQIDGETVADFILGGSKITADGDCTHEIKRHLLLGKKVMTSLDSILKSRDITLSTKIHIVKAMVFPVVMYGCESWTIKKAEHQKMMLLNCGVGEDSWESLGLQGDPTSPS